MAKRKPKAKGAAPQGRPHYIRPKLLPWSSVVHSKTGQPLMFEGPGAPVGFLLVFASREEFDRACPGEVPIIVSIDNRPRTGRRGGKG